MTETAFTPAPSLAADPNAARKDLDGLKLAYMQHLQLRNYTPLSVRQIEQSLRFFIAFMRERETDDVGQVDQDLVERYKTHLMSYQTRKGTHLNVNTIHDRVKIVKRWFLWMRKKGVIFFDPAAAVELPHMAKPLPRGVMTVDEIQKIFKIPNLKNPIAYRDRTIMEVLYATGIRCGELVSLETKDVDLQRRVLKVRFGKGGRERNVPLSTPCCRFLRRYMAEVRPELAQCLRPCGNNWKAKAKSGGDTLFLSIYGGRFSRNWIGYMMRRYIREAGVTRKISPVHGFRHTVATHLLENGMDIRYVQAFLGHETIESTKIYTHVERKKMKELFTTCHPRAMTREAAQPYTGKTRGNLWKRKDR